MITSWSISSVAQFEAVAYREEIMRDSVHKGTLGALHAADHFALIPATGARSRRTRLLLYRFSR